jgi:hypothetical protein
MTRIDLTAKTAKVLQEETENTETEGKFNAKNLKLKIN